MSVTAVTVAVRLSFLGPILLAASPAFAGQTTYPMSMADCLKALGDTAQQLNIPLAYSVNTPMRREFTIATSEGSVVMRCDRQGGGEYDASLTILTPGEVNIEPYVAEGYRRAK